MHSTWEHIHLWGCTEKHLNPVSRKGSQSYILYIQRVYYRLVSRLVEQVSFTEYVSRVSDSEFWLNPLCETGPWFCFLFRGLLISPH